MKLAFSSWFQGTGLSACSNILVLFSILLQDITVLSFDILLVKNCVIAYLILIKGFFGDIIILCKFKTVLKTHPLGPAFLQLYYCGIMTLLMSVAV